MVLIKPYSTEPPSARTSSLVHPRFPSIEHFRVKLPVEHMSCAGDKHTVLLRSHGRVVACGSNYYGKCHIPRLRTWVEALTLRDAALRYVPSQSCAKPRHVRVLQLSFSRSGHDGIEMTCTSLSGEASCIVHVHECSTISMITDKITSELNTPKAHLRLLLPSGGLLELMPAQTRVSDLATM